MIPLGLTAAKQARLNAVCAQHHGMRVRAQILDMNESFISDVTGLLADGQINVDETADITRSLTMTLSDPTRSLSFDTDSPADAALFSDRMIRIYYGIEVDGAWIDVPAFTGPVSKLDRSGDSVSVEAQGKESLGMGASWTPGTWKKGSYKTDVIAYILKTRTGETNMSIPHSSSRLAGNYSLARESVPWSAVASIANGMGQQIFYDGAGQCRMRAYPNTPVFTFTDGATITSPLQVSYTPAACNIVWVKGGVPKGSKTAISYTAVAPSTHPLSPAKLGRHGVPRYLLQVITNDQIVSTADAKKTGDAALSTGLAEAIDASFDAVPIPFLDPGDYVTALTDEGAISFRLKTFSLPLNVTQPMTVGYLRNVAPKARRANRK